MGSLFGSLLGTAGAMRAYERVLSVSQNNVTNASTPGYAKQVLNTEAMAFQPEAGLSGGVVAGRRGNARDRFLEEAVWRGNQAHGRALASDRSLSRLEPLLPVTKETGIPNALNKLFQAFSALSVTPNDTSLRQTVLERARQFAGEMNQTSSALAKASSDAGREIGDTVDRINALAERIHQLNQSSSRDPDGTLDAGVDAQMYSTLEELSELTDFSVLRRPDGTVGVFLGGLTPLVMAESAYPIRADSSGVATVIRDDNGADITAHVTQGMLAAQLDVRNSNIPAYAADLNRLAATVADRVNEVQLAGLDRSGAPAGQPVFWYSTADDAAVTLSVTALGPGDIAAAGVAGPGGNANAIAFAELASSIEIDGYSFTGFYGSIAARLGRERSSAKDAEETESLLLEQARALRQEVSGVNMDEEAARIIEFQRAYQAAAQVFRTLDELTETVINLRR
ncbi:MAG: flagellar hook-associated protein FlgK [Bryobacteraceae bacterium]|nr:flagellar hook-associated protein FlgK [Bryobacteraceae bacterium]